MKKIISLTLGLLLLVSLSVPVFAEDLNNDISKSKPEIVPISANVTSDILYKSGKISEISDTQITVEGVTGNVSDTIVLNVTENTYLVDSISGMPLKEKLKIGDTVIAYYSSVMTRSLPPQSNAYAIVANIPMDYSVPKYVKVEKVETLDDGIRVLVDNGGLYITIKNTSELTSYITKNIVSIADIKVGTELLVWYDIVALSYPGQTSTDKCVILSNNDAIINDIIVSLHAGVVSVNKKEINLDNTPMYEKNNFIMLPLRKIAENLGYKVSWDNATNSAVIENDTKLITISVKDTSISVAANNG